ncbi:DUF4269 domain-containing protein [Pedobacter jamesrossensis]|uniref:DUF4269 domain-containing protein n=1 Tax=Pedobacter jamesrossensis TaxID=1908238 RepID=A0ABV8NHZ9_9SPHI
MINFLDISYLKSGNKKQQKAYQVLITHKIMEKLSAYTPILVGTIPINIDIESSDLDIICYVKDKTEFIETSTNCFQKEKGFIICQNLKLNSIKANFYIDDFEFEIFGQDKETIQQNAFRHMIIEYKLLLEKGENFRQEIIKLKKQGLKTEPAFAKLLGLEGNAYEEILKLEF